MDGVALRPAGGLTPSPPCPSRSLFVAAAPPPFGVPFPKMLDPWGGKGLGGAVGFFRHIMGKERGGGTEQGAPGCCRVQEGAPEVLSTPRPPDGDGRGVVGLRESRRSAVQRGKDPKLPGHGVSKGLVRRAACAEHLGGPPSCPKRCPQRGEQHFGHPAPRLGPREACNGDTG